MTENGIGPPGESWRFERAYAMCLGEFEQLAKSRIVALNIDVRAALITTFGVLPKLKPLREEISRELPKFELLWFDRLETYALALYQAHALFRATRRRPASVANLAKAARKQFTILRHDTRALVSRNLISGEVLKKIGIRRDNVGFALEFLGLSRVLRKAWPQIQGKSALTERDLDVAEQLAQQLVDSVAGNKRPIEERKRVTETRDRAFTLFVTAYGQVQRAVRYLRWEQGDAERIMPSLYRRRARKRVATIADPPETRVSSRPKASGISGK